MPASSSSAPIVLLVQDDGSIEGLYSDDIDLEGARRVERASHVEYSEPRGVWTVVDARSGIELFSDARRIDCLAFEAAYYNERLASGWSPFEAGSGVANPVLQGPGKPAMPHLPGIMRRNV